MNPVPSEWIALLEKEYLAEFVPAGGATVKIGITTDTVPLLDSVAAAAHRSRFVTARVDAGQTRAQSVDQLFFAVARQIDWKAFAEHWLRQTFAANGTPLSATQNLADISALADLRSTSPSDVQGEVNRWIINGILKDYSMGKEFRTAMAMLCRAAINPSNVAPDDADVIIQWLCGEKYSLATLKKLQIFSKIGRHNARLALASLTQWVHSNGHGGLMLLLDARAIWSAPVGLVLPTGNAPLRYTRNATLDFYEVLRQFIDEIDEMEHFILVVAAPPEFWSDPKKGVDQYSALKMRVADDVRDRTRTNPLGAAVRLEVATL